MADALDSGSSVLWGVRVQLPPSAPALYEGIAQVLITLDDSLSHPLFMQGSHLITSSGFVGSRLVFPAQFVRLLNTYLTPTKGGWVCGRRGGCLEHSLPSTLSSPLD